MYLRLGNGHVNLEICALHAEIHTVQCTYGYILAWINPRKDTILYVNIAYIYLYIYIQYIYTIYICGDRAIYMYIFTFISQYVQYMSETNTRPE
jgi:hypothetical protein